MEILTIQKWIENGYGDGFGFGFGDGDGRGDGGGTGRGDGDFDGSGFGSGAGRSDSAGIKFFCGNPVYYIDWIPTIITAVFGPYAKGYILKQSLTLTPCYIAKQESYFAHGETLREAVDAVAEKALDDMPEYGGKIIRKINKDGENE